MVSVENIGVETLQNKPLLGVIPLEAMDLIVDPQHPNYPVALAK